MKGHCRGCNSNNLEVFLDLGLSPIANELQESKDKFHLESKFPLCALVCMNCSFVQLSEELEPGILFPENYTYYSSYSNTWLKHCSDFALRMIHELNLSKDSTVLDIASNDGYLLKIFKDSGIGVLGVEPSEKVADVAKNHEIPTIVDFFGTSLAKVIQSNFKTPNLICVNNVLAHVPNIHDFIQGLAIVSGEDTIISIEFPHLNNLIKLRQFDTIYHEHYSYLSVTSLKPIFEKYGLKLLDIEKLGTHGGSVRLFLGKNDSHVKTNVITRILKEEAELNPTKLNVRSELVESVSRIKRDFIDFIDYSLKNNKKIAGFGAAAKGNTFLNFCEINSEHISCVLDSNIHKQGKFLPGSHIEVVSKEHFISLDPDLVIILPWNLSSEIANEIRNMPLSSCQQFVAIPRIEYV